MEAVSSQMIIGNLTEAASPMRKLHTPVTTPTVTSIPLVQVGVSVERKVQGLLFTTRFLSVKLEDPL